MDDRLPASRFKAWQLFLRVQGRLLERMRVEMEADAGIPLTWFDVMIQLSLVPDEQMRMSDLLHTLMLTRSGLTRRIDRMEAQGLVRRAGFDEDARCVTVALTPQGSACLEGAVPGHLDRISRYFGTQFDEDEAEAAISAFCKILAALEAAPESGPGTAR